MDEEALEQRELSVAEYLALFDKDSADYAYVVSRADRIQSVQVKKLRTPSGIFEDSVFVEKTGVTYTIRTRLS